MPIRAIALIPHPVGTYRTIESYGGSFQASKIVDCVIGNEIFIENLNLIHSLPINVLTLLLVVTDRDNGVRLKASCIFPPFCL